MDWHEASDTEKFHLSMEIFSQNLDKIILKYLCFTSLIYSSSFSTYVSKTFATSALNLDNNKQLSVQKSFNFQHWLKSILICAHKAYLLVSSSVMMTLSLNFGSALLAHQNLWVFFLCSGLKSDIRQKYNISVTLRSISFHRRTNKRYLSAPRGTKEIK